MATPNFITVEGVNVPSVTENQMREVDRIVVEDFGLSILQMMENAGRSLAIAAMEMLPGNSSHIAILAGSGGNGGGGICCARHLHNRGFHVDLFLSKEPDQVRGAAAEQLNIITQSGFQPAESSTVVESLQSANLLIDALIGYSLKGAVRGRISKLIEMANNYSKAILSLDIPSGIDSTSGETSGLFINAERTLTLALPKPGLHNPAAGEIYLADIGIPTKAFKSIGIPFDPFFGDQFIIPLRRSM